MQPITESEKSDARTEAAIYAEGTPFTAEELYRQWVSRREKGDSEPPQGVYEAVLRSHPDFQESWLEAGGME